MTDGVVVVGADGLIAVLGPVDGLTLPEGLPVIKVGWVGPGVVDAHVHLAFGSPEQELRGGVVGVRDLGAPTASAAEWRTGPEGPRRGHPEVRVSGPLITAVDGYPSRSWGAGGFARFVDSPAAAAAAVRDLVRDGVDLIKLALESSGGTLPTPTLGEARAVVQAAHEAGLAVTAHALSTELVLRALEAGVDELCHTPIEPLPPAAIDRIASAGVPVVSTIHTHATGQAGAGVRLNAAALHTRGVQLIYGTDSGNAGTTTGVDPRELTELAEAGLGAEGALRSATEWSSQVAGLRGHIGDGAIRIGAKAALVALAGDPLHDVGAWRSPTVVILGRQVLLSG